MCLRIHYQAFMVEPHIIDQDLSCGLAISYICIFTPVEQNFLQLLFLVELWLSNFKDEDFILQYLNRPCLLYQ